MAEFRFEKLDVWQRAIDFCDDVYRVTQRFPAEERFGLTTQLRKAAVSIPANIAEGSGRMSDRDNLRFVEIAYGSLMEVVSHTEVSLRQEYLNRDQRDELREAAERLSRMLSGLRKHLQPSSITRP